MSGRPPEDIAALPALYRSLEDACDKLRRALLTRPRYGLAMVSEATDLIRSQITERDTPGYNEYATAPGILAWCASLRSFASEYEDLEEEDRQASFGELQEDTELHLATVDYCLEAFHEIVAEERERERESSLVVQQILQQRMAASLASRR